jgi:membrane protein
MSLIAALNRAYGARETRGVLAVQAVALALALYVILFAVCALILVVAVPVALTVLPLGPWSKTAATLAQWLMLIGLEFILLSAFYRFAPDNRARCRWLSAGGALAAFLWLAASALFSLYVEASAIYNQAYGSIGGVAVLLTWLYLSFYVVLLGAELNAAIAAERKGTARAVTPPPQERPIKCGPIKWGEEK